MFPRAVIYCLMAGAQLRAQEWKPWPVQMEWRSSKGMWSYPDHVTWSEGDTHWKMLFVMQGRKNLDGQPSAFDIRTVSSKGAKAHWKVTREGFYEPFMSSGKRGETIFRTIQLGLWQVRELSVDSITNGDPPHGDIWVVSHLGVSGVAMGGCSGRGIIGHQESEKELRLWSLMQGKAGLASSGLDVWSFTKDAGNVSAHHAAPIYLFMLDGGSAGILGKSPEEADRQGMAYYARGVRGVSEAGGYAAPSVQPPREFPFTGFPKWQTYPEHYATDYWTDFHWAWDGQWAEAPTRSMEQPSAEQVHFQWSQEVQVIRGGVDPVDFAIVQPSEAAKLAAQPGWEVVMVHDKALGAIAVTLVAPDFFTVP